MIRQYFSIFSKNYLAACVMFVGAMFPLSANVLANEAITVPDTSVIIQVPSQDHIKLVQAEETAEQKAARLKEERRLERQRKRAERAAKRKKRSSRPRFGSFF